jgi:hypothetical protein
MGTETKFKNAPTLNANLMNLPMMKNYSQSEIVTKVDTFRKGEKNLFWFLKLATVIGVGYLSWVYILPQVFQMLGRWIAIASTGIFLIFLVVAAPAIFAWVRTLARALHASAIKFDPFGQLEVTRQKMLANQSTFRIAKANLQMLGQDMLNESKNAQIDAENGQKEVLKLRGKAENIRSEMEKLVSTLGVAAKEEDEYVNFAAELHKTLAKSIQVANKTKQSQEFTVKFGSRGSVLKKVNQKLVMVEANMDVKISDFDVTVEMLKKDFATGQKLKSATNAAVSVLGFKDDWERDLALDTLANTISADMAISMGNFKDIETLTSNYDLNSDELFENLNAIADKISTGNDPIVTAKKYNNPDYVLTQDDKSKSQFGEMF